ncbi:MAG: HipA domain-containing protein [Campylobacterota bacterium]|nr:HipA domain-containing protein [Campylobacterota bacterium]
MSKLNRNEEVILEYVTLHNIVTTSEIADNTSVPVRTVQRALAKLVKLEFIETQGHTRDRTYKRVFSATDSTLKLSVFSSGILVGELQYGNGEYTFEYDLDYKGESFEGIEADKINRSVELFAYFENLIPESKRRERLLLGKEDIADILRELNNSHGALDFVPKHKLFEYKPQYGRRENWISVRSKILSDNSFPNLLEVEVQIDEEILDATANTEHSDLSGYQIKVDVDIDFKKGIITESDSAEYLLKPRNKKKSNYFNADDDGTNRYYPYIAINEHLFMTFAKNELGFNVPYTGIVKAKDVDFHYVTKRYDRIDGLKYNQVDFAQVLGVKSDNKYKKSSEELFRALDKKLSFKEEKLVAIKFYYYSYLIKHADLHLKNIGALEIGNKKYILAPLYDLISVGVYKGDSWDLGLGMSEPIKKPKNWKMDDFYKLAKIIGITELMFKKEARNITDIFIKEMPKYIKRLEHFEKDHPLPMQKTRMLGSYKGLALKIDNMFKERIISLKKLGFIEELNLVEESGGLLSVQRT